MVLLENYLTGRIQSSQKILGDGCVIIPTDNKIYAPVTGKIGAMVDTGHAVGFISEDGVEVLVHIGMDTVNYEKDYFHLEKKLETMFRQEM